MIYVYSEIKLSITSKLTTKFVFPGPNKIYKKRSKQQKNQNKNRIFLLKNEIFIFSNILIHCEFQKINSNLKRRKKKINNKNLFRVCVLL